MTNIERALIVGVVFTPVFAGKRWRWRWRYSTTEGRTLFETLAEAADEALKRLVEMGFAWPSIMQTENRGETLPET